MATKTEDGEVSTQLSKDDLLKYIELDLWAKFQDRLWKVVGIVLTIITVVGFLGVPYYIRNEVNDTLQKQATDFKQRTEDILSYAKLLAVLSAQHDSERYRFEADVYRLIDAIKKVRADSGEEQPKYRFNDPEEGLAQLISRRDFSKIADGSSIMTRMLFTTPDDLKGKRLLPRTSYIVENKGLSGSGAYSESHPVRDGTYEGAIKDLRFRLVTIEALRRAIASLQDKLLTLGGATEIERRVQTVRVKSLESTEFTEALTKEVTTLANSFLDKNEKQEFARVQSLYLPSDVAKYQAPKTEEPTATKGTEPKPVNEGARESGKGKTPAQK